MIFSPVTAGLYSLLSLGRMGVAWISIATRTIEVVSRILSPTETSPQPSSERQQTFETDPSEIGSTAPEIELTSTDSVPDVFGRIKKTTEHPLARTRSNSPQSPAEQLQTAPIQFILSIITLAIKPKKLRQNSVNSNIDIQEELPHRMHTRAMIAGAIAIHVPRRFERLLRTRNWDPISEVHFREITTEHHRIPSSDIAFEEYLQYILPPTALLLDKTFRIYPESMFREAAAGLLQLGFGLYQLISSDAHFSVERDGLASPFLIVLPYLGMAVVNTVMNILDPPYTVVTVLDISPAARQTLNQRRSEVFLSPTRSSTGYFPPHNNFTDQAISYPDKSPNVNQPDPSSNEKAPDHQVTKPTIITGNVTPLPLVQSPTTFAPSSDFSYNGPGHGTWQEFIQWLQFAYDKRIDASPVDRLYKTPWIFHSIIVGEFIYTTAVGLLIPLVTLAIVGGWTRFRSSNHGLSLTFNLLALFGLPVIQLTLYTHHLFFRVRRDLRGRREHGTFYWEPTAAQIRSEKQKQKIGERWNKIKMRSMWWNTVAQSIGLYFPARRGVIVAYAIFIIGVAICEFAFVGINLQRTLNCQGVLI